MNKEERRKFLEERQNVIGGSDISGVLNTAPWGCARKVFFDKIAFPKDIDDENRIEFRRGRRQEPVAVAYYEELTGRFTAPVKQRRHGFKARCAVNADRLVWKAFKTLESGHKEGIGEAGYLEVKTTSSCYPTKRSGVWEGYIQQVQYGMAVLGVSWGVFVIFDPSKDELLHFDYEADKGLGEILLKAAEEFWEAYVTPRIAPPILPEGANKPCEKCSYRLSCPTFQTKPKLEF